MFKALCLWATFLLFLDSAFANTEMINISSTEDDCVDLPFTDSWPIFRPENSIIPLNVTSAKLGSVPPQDICTDLDKWRPEQPQWCPHELWVVLDLDQDQWKHFYKFSLRLSWAAFKPTDFFIKVYDPTSLASFSNSTATSLSKTRRKYARIQLVHAGVLTPPVNNTLDAISRNEVPFILALDPLHFGVLPSSVIPVILAILAAILLSLPLSGRVYNYLRSIVANVKLEIKAE